MKSQQRILKDKFTEIKHDTQRELVKMSEDRRDVYQQLDRTKEEYDCLKAIQDTFVTDYQAQIADLKQVTASVYVRRCIHMWCNDVYTVS